jgi:hypothetical protein
MQLLAAIRQLELLAMLLPYLSQVSTIVLTHSAIAAFPMMQYNA